MKKIIIALAAGLLGSASAHEMWVEAGHTHGGEILKGQIGYGHNFEAAPIPEERLHFFKDGMTLYGAGGRTTKLVQKGEQNYQYETEAPVRDGSYILGATYAPTFWSHDADQKWKQLPLNEYEGAVYCEQTQMFAKNVLNVGHGPLSQSRAVVTRPVGHALEIVPMVNPATLKVGEPLRVRVLANGEPVVGADLTATFEGFDVSYNDENHTQEAQAFFKKTNSKGEVDIIPLRAGLWKAKVIHGMPYSDQSVCQSSKLYATLTFELGMDHHGHGQEHKH